MAASNLLCVSDVTGVSGRKIEIDVCLNDTIDCPQPQNLSDPENCNKYFVCSGSSLYPRSCKPDESFHGNAYKCTKAQQSCAEPCLDETVYKLYIVYETTVASSTPAATSAAATSRPAPTTVAVVTSTAVDTTTLQPTVSPGHTSTRQTSTTSTTTSTTVTGN